MAESPYLARLERLEGAFVHITDLLVLQSERLDSLREEMHGMRGEMQGMRGEMHGLRDEMRAVRDETRTMSSTLADRLDRLIAITTKDRTMSIERLASIEMRLARLEERVGI
jgi:hypothetical protein